MSSSNYEAPPMSLDANSTDDLPLARFVRNLDTFIIDGQKKDILRPHQRRVFDDVSRFLHSGGTRGFIEMPTGTGKTVLFVSMAEAFSYNDPNPPRILVVTPTRDLVRQTEGGPMNQKGFAGFAPDMEVGTFYSDTHKSNRAQNAQVTITTYASLRLLANTFVSYREDGKVKTIIKNRVNEEYDIVFFDEGHRAQGEGTREIIDSLASDKMLIGFTATPDYSTERKLESILPTMIHKLDIEESIEMNMLSPVLPFAVMAPSTIEYTFAIGFGSDYEKQSLKGLIYDQSRNDMIVTMAAEAVDRGHTPIISCIPGDNMSHPQIIVDALSQRTTTDSYGVTVPIRAVAITSKMSGKARQDIYEELEAGRVHALAYIDVLNEGWDSQAANVLINARPTRSLLAARQRVGRILRPKVDGRPALAIDIIDSISSQTTPPATIADALKRVSLRSGESVGQMAEDFVVPMSELIEQLTSKYGAIKTLTNEHTRFMEEMAQMPIVKRGVVKIENKGKVTTYATPQRLYKRLNVDGFFIQELKRMGVEPHHARIGALPVETFEETTITDILKDLPTAPARGHYYVADGVHYVVIEDIITILQNNHGIEMVTAEDIIATLEQNDTPTTELRFGKYQWAQTHAGVKLYKQRLLVSRSVAQSIVAQFRQERGTNTSSHDDVATINA